MTDNIPIAKLIRQLVAREGWTPDYVAAMPFDQLLAWAGCEADGTISQEGRPSRRRMRRMGL